MEKQKVYAKIPEFDQLKQYIVQLEPVKNGDTLYYGVEIKDLDDTEAVDDVKPIEHTSLPSAEQPAPTLEERAAALEETVQSQSETLDEVVTLLEAIV